MSFALVAKESLLSGEWWIYVIFSLHILVSVLILAGRHLAMLQLVVFVVLTIMGMSAESINELGARHWRSFAREQWFDSRGYFIAVIYTIPLITNSLLIVILWLKKLADLVILFGQMRVRDKARREKGDASSSQSMPVESDKSK